MYVELHNQSDISNHCLALKFIKIRLLYHIVRLLLVCGKFPMFKTEIVNAS